MQFNIMGLLPVISHQRHLQIGILVVYLNSGSVSVGDLFSLLLVAAIVMTFGDGMSWLKSGCGIKREPRRLSTCVMKLPLTFAN